MVNGQRSIVPDAQSLVYWTRKQIMIYLWCDPTCSAQVTVAVLDNQLRVVREQQQTPPRCEDLLAVMAKLLQHRQPAGIAVGLGEGSLTGVRCAVSIANALGFAWQIPVVGVDVRRYRNRERAREVAGKALLQQKHYQPLQPIYGQAPHITTPKHRALPRLVTEHSAGGVVVERGKVLCIFDTERHQLSLPKGKLDPGETAAVAAVREVQEETGYHVRVVQLVGQTRYRYRHADGAVISKTVDYFFCRLVDRRKRQTKLSPHEHLVARWLPVSAALQQLTFPSLRRCVQQALHVAQTKTL